jgi:hypothetical protein
VDLLLTIHGEIRWLVALVALIAIVKFAHGWLTRAEYGRADRALMAAFSGLLDLNLLLGLILLVRLGVAPQRLEHAMTMVIALVIAHASSLWRRATNSTTLFRNNLLAIVVALIVVVVGVARLRGGWMF